MKLPRALAILTWSLVIAVLLAPAVLAAEEEKKEEKEGEGKPPTIDCQMKFNLKGWSAFYKTAKGDGTITCDNGQTASVTIKATGGGITFGTEEIVDGTGRFSEANNIDELFGSYVQSGAHAGAGKSAEAQALTKGKVSLSLVGTGKGVNVGFAFGKFTIQRAK